MEGMNATTEPPSVDRLLAQAPWARRLAYRLVYEADAPDLLQEAWIAAASSERPSHVPWPSWFGGAVRIMGLRSRRDRARRLARERQAGKEALSTAADLSPEALLERAQLQRRVSDLVLALGEPYRSTVLLRYDEGLSAAGIARRLRIPAGTVRWRLKEALDQLRRWLEEQTGGPGGRERRAWALVLAPLAGPRRRSPIVTWAPVLAVTASAVVAVGGLFALQRRQGASGLPATGAPVASSPVPRGQTSTSNKEPDMNHLRPVLTLAMILGLGADADAGNRAGNPLPTSRVARFQVPLGAAPIKGPPGAKVTIVEFTDYECPFCAAGSVTMKALLAAYPKDVRYQVIHSPLPFHKQAPLAARAALAAAQQDKYWEMHDRIFARTNQLARADLERHARDLRLDLPRFRADLDGPAVDRLMEIDEATAKKRPHQRHPDLLPQRSPHQRGAPPGRDEGPRRGGARLRQPDAGRRRPPRPAVQRDHQPGRRRADRGRLPRLRRRAAGRGHKMRPRPENPLDAKGSHHPLRRRPRRTPGQQAHR